MPADSEVRAILLEELNRRGLALEQPSPEPVFAILVDAVVASSRGAAVRALLSHGKKVVQTAREFMRMAAPGWSVTSTDVPSLVSWRDDQEEVTVEVREHQVPVATRPVWQRLFAEIPYGTRDPDADEDSVVRACAYWLKGDPASEADGDVTVYIGKFALTRLPKPQDALGRQLIAHHGGDRHAVGLFAEVTGRSSTTDHLTLYLPDRPYHYGNSQPSSLRAGVHTWIGDRSSILPQKPSNFGSQSVGSAS